MNQAEKLYKFLKTDRSGFLAGSHDIYTPRELVEEILGHIPNVSSDKTILVLFNLEFVISLVYTISVNTKNITLYSDSDNKTKLANRIGVNVITSLDTDMKFEVFVGNPPFKNGNEPGGKSALWRKFVAKSWKLVKEEGYQCMIAPQFSNDSKDLGSIFSDHQTERVWTKISHHFPGVGSSFVAWVVQNTKKTKKTNFIDEGMMIDVTAKEFPKDLISIPILEKMLSHQLFECKSSPEYLHTSVADGKDDDYLSSKPSQKLKYIIRRTSGENYQMYGAVEPTDYYETKVVLTFSGNPHYRFHDKINPIGTIKFQSGHFLVKNKKEGENFIRLYTSKLYKFAQDQRATGGFRGKKIYELPKLDLSRVWTDAELYAHFSLTQEEIDYIETTVK
jgi:hypothetical protein